jgi:CheY-like chemotaxis protein/xanthosine utilization system XapX-like protein
VLEVSLRKAGFTVTPAASVADALDKLELDTPDLIISETKFPTDLDGFELRRRVRGAADWAEIPFVFLTAETAIEHKIRGLELGVDDYLTKPIYIKEIVTRINILLQKRQRAHFDERKDGVRFAGRVADMPVVDVIQTIEVSRKSGVIQFVADRHRTAAIYFRDGKVIDAEAGTLQGEDAVYRLLTWSEGEFEVVFRTVRRREVITTSSQGLLMEGMRRLDEWSRLLEQLPPLSHRFEIDTPELAARLGEVPDDNNPILRLVDGKRSLLEVIDSSDFGDLECLQAVTRLYFEGLLVDLDPEQRPKRDTGKSMPLVILEPTPTPIEEVASGPIHAERGASIVEEITPPPRAAPTDTSDPVFSGEDEIEALEAPPTAADLRESVVGEEEVLSEEDAPGPLMGGYRPSSLRLIDEAVAAAQAIDPSLFESDLVSEPAQLARVQLATRESDPRIANARNVVEKTDLGRNRPKSVPPAIRDAIASSEILLPTDGEEPRAPRAARQSDLPFGAAPQPIQAPLDGEEPELLDDGIPQLIEGDEDDDEGDTSAPLDGYEEPTEPERPPFVAKRDPADRRRMTSSHGHDRAEASGELVVVPPGSTPPKPDPARELITIMPRRITREVPVVPAPEPTPVVATEAPPVQAPQLPPPRPRVPMGTGVVRPHGPGPVVMALVVLASLMAGMAIYLWVHKHLAKQQVAVAGDASEIQMSVVDAAPPLPDAEQIAIAPAPDAGVRVAPVDAGVRVASIDAGARVATADAGIRVASADAGLDRNKEASALRDQAQAALDEGDPDKALELADASIKLRRTAQAFLVRAGALERLDHVDEALSALEEATQLAPTYPLGWHRKGMLLWSARRRDEAKTALDEYLRLAPDAKDAATVRQMLGEP